MRDLGLTFMPSYLHIQRTDSLVLLPCGEALVHAAGNFLCAECGRIYARVNLGRRFFGMGAIGPYVLLFGIDLVLVHMPTIDTPPTPSEPAPLVNDGDVDNELHWFMHCCRQFVASENSRISSTYAPNVSLVGTVNTDSQINAVNFVCYGAEKIFAVLVSNSGVMMLVPFNRRAVSLNIADQQTTAHNSMTVQPYIVESNWSDGEVGINSLCSSLVGHSTVRSLLIFDAHFFALVEFDLLGPSTSSRSNDHVRPLRRKALWNFNSTPLSQHTSGQPATRSHTVNGLQLEVSSGQAAKEIITGMASYFIYLSVSTDKKYVAMSADLDAILAVYECDADAMRATPWGACPLRLSFVVKLPPGCGFYRVEPYGSSAFVVIMHEGSRSHLVVVDPRRPDKAPSLIPVGPALAVGISVDSEKREAVVAVVFSNTDGGGVVRLELPKVMTPHPLANDLRERVKSTGDLPMESASVAPADRDTHRQYAFRVSRILKRRCPFGHFLQRSAHLVGGPSDAPVDREDTLFRSSSEARWLCGSCSKRFDISNCPYPPLYCDQCLSVFCETCHLQLSITQSQ
uniref:Uncharacterized protein n=1 Tax=Trypanosoma vivax (strain Y486) TaxID=1055687 RepID=G0TS90_TRYVY|nr:conserved hypothetical protein [Trypanosoma vivax Y486]